MRTTSIPTPVLAVALQACTAEPELLNSERIARTFGSYGIDVLQASGALRRSNLYSLSDGLRVCRTYAAVQFLQGLDERTPDEHSEIARGASIGEVFKAHGWRILKQTLHVGALEVAGGAGDIRALMCLREDDTPAVHIYRLLIEKQGDSIEYATIIEVHHPEYLDVAGLQKLYPVSESTILSKDQVSALVSLVTDSKNN